jgi:hypothetical protein
MQKHLPVAATNHRTVSGDCPALWRGGAQACLLKINTYMSVAGKPGMRTGPLIFRQKNQQKYSNPQANKKYALVRLGETSTFETTQFGLKKLAKNTCPK